MKDKRILPIKYNMDYIEFREKWRWQRVDFDKFYRFQCTDLIRQYGREVFGKSLPSSWWSARSWRFQKRWKNKKIPNTPEWAPQQWDIIFFDATPRNSFWHVWVVESADVKTVVVLDQNWWVWKWNWIAWDEIQLRKFNYIRPRCLWRIRLTSKK